MIATGFSLLPKDFSIKNYFHSNAKAVVGGKRITQADNTIHITCKRIVASRKDDKSYYYSSAGFYQTGVNDF